MDQVSYSEYDKMLEDQAVREKVAMALMSTKSKLKDSNIKELATQLQKTDMDIFEKVRNGQLSLDQLKSRNAERKHGLRYVVLDDILDGFGELFKDEVHMAKTNCGTHVGRHEHINKKASSSKGAAFTQVSREKGMPHQNFQTMPDSLGLDFYQKDNCEKVGRCPKPRIMKSYKSQPQPIARKKESKVDMIKLKKQDNAEKLKRNLARKLYKHRQIELRQMPFDSSKVEFHDKMDMFYKLHYLKRPIEDQAHYELMQKTKKKPKEENKTRDEILFE